MSLEKVLKDKEELIETILKLLEGKEAKATLNLNGIKFMVGKSSVSMSGKIEFVFVPVEEKPSKKK